MKIHPLPVDGGTIEEEKNEDGSRSYADSKNIVEKHSIQVIQTDRQPIASGDHLAVPSQSQTEKDKKHSS